MITLTTSQFIIFAGGFTVIGGALTLLILVLCQCHKIGRELSEGQSSDEFIEAIDELEGWKEQPSEGIIGSHLRPPTAEEIMEIEKEVEEFEKQGHSAEPTSTVSDSCSDSCDD